MNIELFILLTICVLAFLNAANLYYQHWRVEKMKQNMMCPVGFDCEAVVGSKFGKTFGLNNEIAGMGFYALLILLLIIPFFSDVYTALFNDAVWYLSIFGAIFSTYLLFLQIFIIKKYCFWCLISILLSYLLLGSEIYFRYF